MAKSVESITVCVYVCVVRSVGKHTFLKLEVLAVVDIKHIEECV